MATVKFYQDTNEEWIFSDGKSGLEYTIQASQAGRIINGSQVALIDKSLSGPGRIHFLFEDKFVEVTEIEKNSSGDFYSDIDDFKESCADFFVNAGGGVGDMDDLLEAMGIDKSEFSSTQGIAYDSETNTFYPTDLNFTGTAVDSEATEGSINAAQSGDSYSKIKQSINTLIKTYNSNYNFIWFAKVGDTTPTATLNNVYIPSENGTIFDQEITDYTSQILVGNAYYFDVIEIQGNYIESTNITPNIALENIIENYSSYSGRATLSENEDGSINIQHVSTHSGWVYFLFKTSQYWKANHRYIAIVDVKVNTNEASSSGYMFSSLLPKNSTSQSVEVDNSIITNQIKVGDRDYALYAFDTAETISYENAQFLYLQPGSYDVDAVMDIDIYDIMIVDLGDLDSSELIEVNDVIEFVQAYGIVKEYNRPYQSYSSNTSKELKPTSTIYGYGDSLMDQGWITYVGEATDRTVVEKGYAGQTSSYIRDQYFATVTDDIREATHIFNVGRNNYTQTDIIIEDIRSMVEDLGHNKFLILNPPNGGYSTEFSDSSSYDYFERLEQRLADEYPNNFINIRKATIEGWHSHYIRLAASFTQPAVGDSVQITIANDTLFSNEGITDSPTTLLTSENSSDVTSFPTYSGRIVIGDSYDYDVYEVVSVDSDTTLTISLLESNRIAEGGTVENSLDGNGVATTYLKIRQYYDQYFWEKNTTLSTYRKDSVHLNVTYALPFYAEIVRKALERLGI